MRKQGKLKILKYGSYSFRLPIDWIMAALIKVPVSSDFLIFNLLRSFYCQGTFRHFMLNLMNMVQTYDGFVFSQETMFSVNRNNTNLRKKQPHLNKVLLLLVFSCLFISASSQPSGYLYGIHIDNANYFSKIDFSNNQFTDMDTIPFGTGGMYSNSCFADKYQEIFYYSSGKSIGAFDINSGSFLFASVLNIPSTAEIFAIDFNPCDSSIYGILVDLTLITVRLVKIEPASGSVTIISAANIGGFPGPVGGYFIDPVKNSYVFLSGNFAEVDLSTGMVTTNIPVVDLPGESFAGVTLECSTGNIYGTSMNASIGSRYLSTIDRNTGVVTHVSANNLSAYYWQSAFGGVTINQTGTYFYQSTNNLFLGVDLLSGNPVTFLSPAAPGFFIKIFSYPQCDCNGPAGLDEALDDLPAVKIIHNPVSQEISISYADPSHRRASISVRNIIGETLYSRNDVADGSVIRVAKSLAQGIYLVDVVMDDYRFSEKFLIR